MKRISFTFIIFLSILLLAIFSFGYGNDYYWHTKAGEYILNHLSIPYHDVFSWYGIENNLYWMSHEWLSEVIIYIYDALFKNFGPLMFTIINYLIIILLLYKFNKEKLEKNIIFTFVFALIGLLIFSTAMLPRPHMLSYILLIFSIYVLYDNYNNENSKKIYSLPIISMILANVHGGSSNLPYILCVIFLICSLINFKFNKLYSKRLSIKQIKKYVICFILSVFAVLINPHGIKMLLYPYVNMADSLMLSGILEWASPSLNNPSDYINFVLIIIIMLIFVITNKKIKLIDLVLMGFFVVLELKSVRFAPLLYMTSIFVIPNYIEEKKIDIPKSLFIIIFISILLCGSLLSQKLVTNYNKVMIPKEVIVYIKEKKPKRLYNFYDYGGYLIYNNIKVFIDGRADMYSKYTLKDTLDLQNKGYQGIIDKYDFDMIIIPNSLVMSEHIKQNEKYELTKESGNVLIYEKIK